MQEPKIGCSTAGTDGLFVILANYTPHRYILQQWVWVQWDRRDREVWERVSIQKQNRPVQVALTAWQRAAGGYTSADAPNVGESAAAITHQTNMPQNTTRAPVIPLSRASSTERIGSTITAQEISLPGQSYQAPTPIPWTNPCLDQLDGCPQNGNRSLTNRVWVGIS